MNGTTEVWGGPLLNNELVLALVNRGATPATISAQWSLWRSTETRLRGIIQLYQQFLQSSAMGRRCVRSTHTHKPAEKAQQAHVHTTARWLQ